MSSPKQADTDQREHDRHGGDARRLRERQRGIELAGESEMPDRNAEITQGDDRGECGQILHLSIKISLPKLSIGVLPSGRFLSYRVGVGRQIISKGRPKYPTLSRRNATTVGHHCVLFCGREEVVISGVFAFGFVAFVGFIATIGWRHAAMSVNALNLGDIGERAFAGIRSHVDE